MYSKIVITLIEEVEDNVQNGPRILILAGV